VVLIIEVITLRKEYDKTRSRGLYALSATNFTGNLNFLTDNVIRIVSGRGQVDNLTLQHGYTVFQITVSAQDHYIAGHNHTGHFSFRNLQRRNKIKAQYLPFHTCKETSQTYNKLRLESSTCPTHGYFCIFLYCITYIIYVIKLVNVFTYFDLGKVRNYAEKQPNLQTAFVTFQMLVISSLLPTHH
jgi:hypothetical protein